MTALLSATALLSLALSAAADHVLYQPNTKLCLAASDAEPGTPVRQVKCDPSRTETHRWTALVPPFKARPNHLQLRNGAGKCLTNALTQDVCQVSASDSEAQLWTLNYEGTIRDSKGLYLTSKSTSDLVLQPEPDSWFSAWDLRVPEPEPEPDPEINHIYNKQTLECLTAAEDDSISSTACNLAELPSQHFNHVAFTNPVLKGFYALVNPTTSKCLARAEGPDDEPQAVHMADCATTQDVLQAWKIGVASMIPNSNGKVLNGPNDNSEFDLKKLSGPECEDTECKWFYKRFH